MKRVTTHSVRCGLRAGICWPRTRLGSRAQLGNGLGGEMLAADDNALLTPAEVAALFRVNAKTVTRWARAGKLSAVRTLGGHRRFRRDEVEAQLQAQEVLS